MRCACLTDRAGQAACVDATNCNATTCGQPFAQWASAAPVRRCCWVPLDHHALSNRISGFVIFRVYAGITDVRERECDDLTCI